MHIHAEFKVCADCVQLIANGELPPHMTDDEVEAYLKRIETRWGDLQGHAVLAGEENEEASFSSVSCGYCGERRAGDRYPAAILCSHEECAK